MLNILKLIKTCKYQLEIKSEASKKLYSIVLSEAYVN